MQISTLIFPFIKKEKVHICTQTIKTVQQFQVTITISSTI